MAKYEPKTKATAASVEDYVAAIDNGTRRADAEVLLALYTDITGMDAQLWGPSIIGFGRYSYETKSGCAGDMPRAAFSPRKANLVIYMNCGYSDAAMEVRMAAMRERLGKHKSGASCLYITKLADVDLDVLRTMIETDLAWMDRKYPRA